MSSRLLVLLVCLASLLAPVARSGAQSHSKASPSPQVLSLSFANNGQRIAARSGDQIEITLGTVGPKQYGEPWVSSAAVKLESTALDWPANPGGPRFIYIFDAAEPGEAQVTVPLINTDTPEMHEQAEKLVFSAIIVVSAAHQRAASAHVPYAARTLDQANTAPWGGAWTNLANDVQQTFTPSPGRVTGIEVALAPVSSGTGSGSGASASAEVTLSLLDGEGKILAVVSKTVSGAPSQVLFALPHGGVRVSPGQVYRIRVSGGAGIFGWKYVVGGYANGAAFFNGRPLLREARSTFLFRTFGGE